MVGNQEAFEAYARGADPETNEQDIAEPSPGALDFKGSELRR